MCNVHLPYLRIRHEPYGVEYASTVRQDTLVELIKLFTWEKKKREKREKKN